jgi:hypothetical protein
LDKGGQNAHPKSPLFRKKFEKNFFDLENCPKNAKKAACFSVEKQAAQLRFYSDVLHGHLFLSCFCKFDKDIIYCVRISALRYQIIFKGDQRLQNLSVLLVIKIDMKLPVFHQIVSFILSVLFSIQKTSAG